VQLLSGIKVFTGYRQVLEIQDRKKKLIKEVRTLVMGIILRALWLTHSIYAKAFSGMKNKETPRQKKEARLQGLASLFRPLSDELLLMRRDTLELVELFGIR